MFLSMPRSPATAICPQKALTVTRLGWFFSLIGLRRIDGDGHLVSRGQLTIIGFQLPEAANASLTIFDVSGKLLKVVDGQFTQGYHEISIEDTALPGNGIFYYRLETPTHTATKKMTRL